MVAFTLLTVLVTALAASQQALAEPAPSALPALLARQSSPPIDTSKIPSQCQSSCKAAVSGCTDSIDCVCTDKKADDIASCFSCFVTVKDSGINAQTAQTAVDGCKGAGKPVKAATISTSSSGAAPIGLRGSGIFALVTLGAVGLLA